MVTHTELGADREDAIKADPGSVLAQLGFDFTPGTASLLQPDTVQEMQSAVPMVASAPVAFVPRVVKDSSVFAPLTPAPLVQGGTPQAPTFSGPALPSSAPSSSAPSAPAFQARSRRELRERERAAGRHAASVVVPPAEPEWSGAVVSAPASHVPVERVFVGRSADAGREPVSQAAPSTRARRVAPSSRSARRAAVRPHRRTTFKRLMISKLMPLGAMLGAGLMVIATTVPANAFYSPVAAAPVTAKSSTLPVQSLKLAAAAAAAPDAVVARDAYTVSSLADQVRLLYGNRSFSYTTDPNGTVRWPFPIPVPISSGFGARAGCSIGCSTFHEGIDFTPGAGTPIQAIADGVVSVAEYSYAGYGNYVIIDHVINGQKVQSMYAHMQSGSVKVVVGQQVKVGDIVGQVGSTGIATGPHLHFEIIINDVPVDPYAWLKANAK